MAESPRRRANRPASREMWDEPDRRPSGSNRDGGESREQRGDRERDRNRRYRSRSPRRNRDRDRDHYRDRDRDHDRRRERLDTRESEGNRERDLEDKSRRQAGNEKNGTSSRRDTGRSWHDKDRARDRSRSRSTEGGRRRSRSPRRDREREKERVKGGAREMIGKGSDRRHDDRDVVKGVKEKTRASETAEKPAKSRSLTPSFSVKDAGGTSNGGGQDHDGMEIDGEASNKRSKDLLNQYADAPAYDDKDIIVEDGALADMQAMMGFGGFGTTHQKKVAGNDVYAVRKEKKTQYRQYMNRVGGFNRPLSPPREK